MKDTAWGHLDQEGNIILWMCEVAGKENIDYNFFSMNSVVFKPFYGVWSAELDLKKLFKRNVLFVEAIVPLVMWC